MTDVDDFEASAPHVPRGSLLFCSSGSIVWISEHAIAALERNSKQGNCARESDGMSKKTSKTNDKALSLFSSAALFFLFSTSLSCSIAERFNGSLYLRSADDDVADDLRGLDERASARKEEREREAIKLDPSLFPPKKKSKPPSSSSFFVSFAHTSNLFFNLLLS